METPVKGEVVVVPFPFSDLSQAKRRPALVVANLKGDDLILCQITSKEKHDDYAVELLESDFQNGGLKRPSNVRPNRLFTAHRRLVLYRAGRISPASMNRVTDTIIRLLRA
jgi:mRNA interferase MazF